MSRNNTSRNNTPRNNPSKVDALIVPGIMVAGVLLLIGGITTGNGALILVTFLLVAVSVISARC